MDAREQQWLKHGWSGDNRGFKSQLPHVLIAQDEGPDTWVSLKSLARDAECLLHRAVRIRGIKACDSSAVPSEQ